MSVPKLITFFIETLIDMNNNKFVFTLIMKSITFMFFFTLTAVTAQETKIE